MSDFSENEEVALEVPTQEELLTDNNRTQGKLNFGALNVYGPQGSDPPLKMETPEN